MPPDFWRNIPDDFRTWLKTFTNRTEFNASSLTERAELRERFDRSKRENVREERESAMQSMLQLLMASRVNPYAAISASHFSKDDSLAARTDSVAYYGLQDENVCQVLGVVNSSNVSVINAHIWPRHAAADMVIFDLQPDQIHSPQNVLRLQREIERAFDSRRLTFVANHDDNLVVKILDPSAMSEPLNGTTKTFRDIDGHLLKLPNGKLPFRRLLANHSVLAHKHAREKGWIGQDLSEVEVRAETLMAHSLDRDASFRLKTLWGNS
jgi:hypothetical protein